MDKQIKQKAKRIFAAMLALTVMSATLPYTPLSAWSEMWLSRRARRVMFISPISCLYQHRVLQRDIRLMTTISTRLNGRGSTHLEHHLSNYI